LLICFSGFAKQAVLTPFIAYLRYVDSKGVSRVCGGADLKGSQHYPALLGQAVAQLYLNNHKSMKKIIKQREYLSGNMGNIALVICLLPAHFAHHQPNTVSQGRAFQLAQANESIAGTLDFKAHGQCMHTRTCTHMYVEHTYVNVYVYL